MSTTSSARFRPHEHIRHADDFRRVFARKCTVSNAWVVVHAFENGLEHARLGISAPKRKLRHAVERNRCKRLVREVFRLTKPQWPVGFDYVVVMRSGVPTFDFLCATLPELSQAIARRLARSRGGFRPGPITTGPRPRREPT